MYNSKSLYCGMYFEGWTTTVRFGYIMYISCIFLSLKIQTVHILICHNFNVMYTCNCYNLNIMKQILLFALLVSSGRKDSD